MQVHILEEAGFKEALFGLGLSFGLTSGDEGYKHIYEPGLSNDGSVFSRLKNRSYKLAGLGKGHDKFLRQLIMWVEVDAPLYWWKQMDQYKVATVTQSESTMHTLMKRPLTQDDFEGGIKQSWLVELNEYIDAKDFDWVNRHLPQSFLQKRILSMSYATARNIIEQRHKHKLVEWEMFINAIISQALYPEYLVPNFMNKDDKE